MSGSLLSLERLLLLVLFLIPGFLTPLVDSLFRRTRAAQVHEVRKVRGAVGSTQAYVSAQIGHPAVFHHGALREYAARHDEEASAIIRPLSVELRIVVGDEIFRS